MKNALLLVALFLGGMTTQTIAQRGGNVHVKTGKKHRYYNSQSVSFVENGVLFTVFTDGTFSFTDRLNGQPYRFNRRNHNTNFYGNKRRFRRCGNEYRPIRIQKDRFGNIIAVNRIPITYKRNGKVRQIGSVPIYHQRGYMIQVGGMSIQYDRFRNIRNTFGHINRYNRKVWHDDWYSYNDYGNDYWNDDWDDDDRDDDWDDDDRNGRRSRK